ncbi:MAG TPA: glutamate 5-kinase [Sphaerochaeta sp.]|nr:glutamate 5-kinase [Spirochaetales bacterium]HPX28210.1 glutamate 5-kinase [Sphaerochaeta sp.]HQB54048.1 glutamate 5-kinase [Sphaerochaeta sp.]
MKRDLPQVKRVVVKVGTNLLSTKAGIDEAYIDTIASQIAALMEKGYQVLLVSSGAIGMGAKELRLKGPVKQTALRQACASIGNPLLMTSYRRAFKAHGLICSQILLTRLDVNNRRTYVNLRNSVSTLLELGVVPIFNENDVVSIDSLGSAFGDNDRMSAFIASKIDAELLIILTDIDGLYDADPKKDPDANLLSEIVTLDSTILSYAAGAGSTHSTGGMKTKLLAAKIAAVAGCGTIIASGYEPDIIVRLLDGETLGTYIHPTKALSQRQRWILNNSFQGSIEIDEGAKNALLKKKSLLPKGVVRVDGTFGEGAIIEVRTPDGSPFARAVSSFSSADLKQVAGHDSSEFAVILGSSHKGVIFRPEDMVFLENDN